MTPSAIKSLFAHELPPEEVAHGQIRLASWPTKPWNSFGGRLTFCGDAVHPMPFHRGQGLNNALNDVANLLDAIKKVVSGGDLKEEIEKYNSEVVERGSKAVEESIDVSAEFAGGPLSGNPTEDSVNGHVGGRTEG